MYPRDGEVRITAPSPGKCPICATEHDPADPHDRNSLYYQNRFRKTHKRFPTWGDAMAHCKELTKTAWKAKLMAEGVSPEEFEDNGNGGCGAKDADSPGEVTHVAR